MSGPRQGLARRDPRERSIGARSTRPSERRNLRQEQVRGALAAIAADAEERLLVALGALGGAGVADERHQIAEIAGVAHRALDALVGHHSRHDQRAHAEIPQYVIDVGRNKNAARRLAKDHLVAYRGDLVEHPRIPRSLRYVDTRDLVVEAAVTAVPGHVLDGRRTAEAADWAARFRAGCGRDSGVVARRACASRCRRDVRSNSGYRRSTEPHGPDRSERCGSLRSSAEKLAVRGR